MGTYFTAEYSLVCEDCGLTNLEEDTTSGCTICSGPLSVIYSKENPLLQLPLQKDTPPDRLRLTPTPLHHFSVRSEEFGIDLYAKLECQNPTGSFKDRGSYVEVLKAIQMGKRTIVLASTGNMAASVAQYAYAYGISCQVIVPESTNQSKLAQAAIMGAEIVCFPGDYSSCEREARRRAKESDYFLAGDYCFRQEGQKSFSYELLSQCPQMDFDFIIVPVGCGTNISAIGKGLIEIEAAGLLPNRPQLVAVQASGSAAAIESFYKNEKSVWSSTNTYAQATAVSDPLDWKKVKNVLDWSNGFPLVVDEYDLLYAQDMQLIEGVFSEPSGALPFAAVMYNQAIFRGSRVLLVVTGHGLKDPAVVPKVLMEKQKRSPELALLAA